MLLRHLRKSLFSRLLFLCMLGIFLVDGANTSAWLYKFDEEATRAFERRGEDLAKVLADAVAQPTWDLDAGATQSILAGFQQVDGFVFAEVFESGSSFSQFLAPSAPETAFTFSTQLSQLTDVRTLRGDGIVFFKGAIGFGGARRDFGTVVVGFSVASLQAAMAETRRITILLCAISFGTLSVLVFLALRRVSRPLKRVTDVITDATQGQLKHAVPYLDRDDEVGRLASAVSVFQDSAACLAQVEAEAKASRIIAEQAMCDALTGLPNRRALAARFAALAETRPEGDAARLAIIHVDLDGFKHINDSLGHNAGDHMLEHVAARLRDAGQACCLIARTGGDEFVALYSETPSAGVAAPAIAERLVSAVGAPTVFEGRTIRVGCSAGVAYHTPENADLFETLAQADCALYRAKKSGRGRAVVFDDSQRAELARRRVLATQIESGLGKGEFVPFFQPIMCSQSGAVTSVEVLVRWRHPDYGLLSPAQFLDLAEELRLLKVIDREVFSASINLFKRLGEEVATLPRLAVNVSHDRLMEPEFLTACQQLKGTRVGVDVELLESTYLDEVSDPLIWRLDALRDAGARILVDDFGTGHASLAGLVRISPDGMKIDRRFIQSAADSATGRKVFQTILSVAAALDLHTVCEGVETEAQADLARDMGCHSLQGFHLHKPMCFDDLRQVLLIGSLDLQQSAV